MTAPAPRKATALPPTRHADDLFTWVKEQCALLRTGSLKELDHRLAALELSHSGNEIRNKLQRSIASLAQHLLKWDYQPERRSRSWEQTICERRQRIEDVLEQNPSLRPALSERVSRGYATGRRRALVETKLPKAAFPTDCPYTFDEMMGREIEFVPPPARRRGKGR